MRGPRETWDRVAVAGRDELIGDPERGKEELRALFGRLGGPPEGRRCLEIGCGLGRMTVALAEQFEEVLAVDVSPRMIEQARSVVAGRDGVRFHTVPGDSLEGVPDGWADVLVCYLVLQHFPSLRNVTAYFTEFERVLAAGGEAFVQLPVLEPHLRARTQRRLRHLAVRVQAPLATSPRCNPSYRGFRITSDELRRILDELDLEEVAVDRDPRSPYRYCEDVFLRLRRPR
jgi:ubiquinone/menaquinone biosynthesis C-methylase UbiE